MWPGLVLFALLTFILIAMLKQPSDKTTGAQKTEHGNGNIFDGASLAHDIVSTEVQSASSVPFTDLNTTSNKARQPKKVHHATVVIQSSTPANDIAVTKPRSPVPRQAVVYGLPAQPADDGQTSPNSGEMQSK